MALMPPKQLDEIEQLLSQIKLRRRDALEQLYKLTSARLYAIVLRIVQNREDAGDVLQETFVKIWRGSDQFRLDMGNAWGWLCQVARNCALDRMRKHQRTREIATEDVTHVLDALEGQHTDPGLASDLDRCLQRLKAEARRAVVLSYVYGLSHSELIRYIDAPLGTVKAWIRRGLMELRVCLRA